MGIFFVMKVLFLPFGNDYILWKLFFYKIMLDLELNSKGYDAVV